MDSFTKFELVMIGLTALPVLIYFCSPLQSLFEKAARGGGVSIVVLPFSLSWILSGYAAESDIFRYVMLSFGFCFFTVFYGAGVALLLKERRKQHTQ